jgi:hypothetical protein
MKFQEWKQQSMKRLVYFEIVDFGIQEGIETPKAKLYLYAQMLREPHSLFNGYVTGVGTDAESALDDLLHTMQECGYDVAGLEGQIKEGWEPSMEEGDGRKFYYHLGLVFKWTQ